MGLVVVLTFSWYFLSELAVFFFFKSLHQRAAVNCPVAQWSTHLPPLIQHISGASVYFLWHKVSIDLIFSIKDSTPPSPIYVNCCWFYHLFSAIYTWELHRPFWKQCGHPLLLQHLWGAHHLVLCPTLLQTRLLSPTLLPTLSVNNLDEEVLQFLIKNCATTGLDVRLDPPRPTPRLDTLGKIIKHIP